MLILKKLEKLINEEKIPNKYMSNIYSVCDYLKCDDEYENLTNRFKAIDLKYNYSLVSKSNIENINMRLVDRFDNNSIIGLNSKYYKDNPIRLIELFEGVRY